MVCWARCSENNADFMLIDTHCHLDATEFDLDRAAMLERARVAGVNAVVIPAVAASNFLTVQLLAHQAPSGLQASYALGIHPLYTGSAVSADLEHLEALAQTSLSDPLFIGIGEIGLDLFVPGLDLNQQIYFFEAQLGIAKRLGLPVILHVRRALDLILKRLRSAQLSGGIAHAFNGSAQQAEQFIELGFALGFGGAMTFTRALQIRRLVLSLPASAHVLETDAPDISPEWVAKQRNESAHLPQIAQVFADLRGVSLSQAIEQTGLNAVRVLPRLVRKAVT
jgi:TatD DNase family protein